MEFLRRVIYPAQTFLNCKRRNLDKVNVNILLIINLQEETMRTVIIILLSIIPLVSFSQLIPDFYLDYDEIMDSLYTLESMYPDKIDIFQIGTTVYDSLPIYAVKVSNNVMENRDVPRLLFVMQVHGEEIDMTQLPLKFIPMLVQNGGWPWSVYRDAVEIYFVPSANPEGMSVVMEELDITYRKNKRDNVGDGLFRFIPPLPLGYDSSGIDPNRNFDFNWIHGDTLWSIAHTERYDYYRGAYPFSEGMTDAIRDFAEEKHFSLGIVFHQSRSGNFSEKVIHSWDWEQCGKLTPDNDVIEYIGNELANQIAKLGGTGYYERNHAGGKYGNSHDWMYAKMGCYQYTVETSGIQQTSQSNLNIIINNNILGMRYLIERAIGFSFSTNWDELAQLTGIVTDGVTSEPLLAEVKIVGRESGLLAPRMTLPEFGRYRFILNHGGHTLQVSKPGYLTYTQALGIGSTQPTTHNVQLQPLPYHEVTGSILENGTLDPIDGTIYFSGNMMDTVEVVDGAFTVFLPESVYDIRFDSEGYVSRFDFLALDSQVMLDYVISPAQYFYDEDFESGSLGSWETGGDEWSIDAGDSHSGMYSVSDSPSALYENNVSGYIERSFDLTDDSTAHLTFWHKYYLEPEYDLGYVDVSLNGGTDWTSVAAYDLQEVDWRQEYIDLTPFCGNEIIIRFLLDTDATLTEPGWSIDDIAIRSSSDFLSVENPDEAPNRFYVENPYPNPFNSSTSIRFNLDKSSDMRISVFDVLGREIAVLNDQRLPAGLNMVKWSAEEVSSGIFFIRLASDDHESVKKILLLK